MSSRRFFYKGDKAINIFIGGVGASSITSEADYASSSNLPASEISQFSIDANDNVSFRAESTHGLSSGAFNSSTDIKYFVDIEKKVTSLTGVLSSTPNLKHLFLSGLLNSSTSGNTANGMSGLLKINLDSLADLKGRGFMNNANKLKVIKAPSANGISQSNNQSYSNFTNLTSLERLYIPNVLTFTNTAYNSLLLGQQFSNIKSGCKIYFNSTLSIIQDRKAFNRISFSNNSVEFGDSFFIGSLEYVCVQGDPVNPGEFEKSVFGNVLASQLYNALVTDSRPGASDFTYVTFGGTVSIQNKSVGVSGEISTTENPSNVGTATFEKPTLIGGNDAHALVVMLREYYNCTMIPLSSPIPVNAPTTLSFSNLTATTVDLNFTAPTPNANGIDAYEVWIDDGTLYRKLFEYSEISGSGSTVDLQEIIDDIGSFDGAKIKIRTIDGQMNFSEFTEEITITV